MCGEAENIIKLPEELVSDLEGKEDLSENFTVLYYVNILFYKVIVKAIS